MEHAGLDIEDDPRALWPEAVVRLGTELREASGARRSEALGRLWVLLNLALQKYARGQARRLGRLGSEDIRDVAAEKASDLILRLDNDQWNPAASSPAQLCSFLATVARNGVVDALRTTRREVASGHDLEARETRAVGAAVQEDAIGGDEFARALVACASSLTSRSRRAWLLRVFYDFSSAEIARHPEVTTSPAGVDAMLARCREHLRACLEERGLPMRAIPAGTFARLWELIEGGGA